MNIIAVVIMISVLCVASLGNTNSGVTNSATAVDVPAIEQGQSESQ